MKKFITVLISVLLCLCLGACSTGTQELEFFGLFNKDIVLNRMMIINEKCGEKFAVENTTVLPMEEDTSVWEIKATEFTVRYLFDGTQVEAFFEDVEANNKSEAVKTLSNILKIFTKDYNDNSFANNVNTQEGFEESKYNLLDRLENNPQRIINLIGNGTSEFVVKNFNSQGFNISFEQRTRSYEDGTVKYDFYFVGEKA